MLPSIRMVRPSAMSSECLLMVTMKNREQVYSLPLYFSYGSNEDDGGNNDSDDRVMPLKNIFHSTPFAVFGPSKDFYNVQMFHRRRRLCCCCY